MLKNKILELINSKIAVDKISIIDLTEQHKKHEKSNGGGHFKLKIVSNNFNGKSLLERHKMIYSILEDMLKNEIHALSLKTLTIEEFKK